jgi:hypothetical protein
VPVLDLLAFVSLLTQRGAFRAKSVTGQCRIAFQL